MRNPSRCSHRQRRRYPSRLCPACGLALACYQLYRTRSFCRHRDGWRSSESSTASSGFTFSVAGFVRSIRVGIPAGDAGLGHHLCVIPLHPVVPPAAKQKDKLSNVRRRIFLRSMTLLPPGPPWKRSASSHHWSGKAPEACCQHCRQPGRRACRACPLSVLENPSGEARLPVRRPFGSGKRTARPPTILSIGPRSQPRELRSSAVGHPGWSAMQPVATRGGFLDSAASGVLGNAGAGRSQRVQGQQGSTTICPIIVGIEPRAAQSRVGALGSRGPVAAREVAAHPPAHGPASGINP